MRLRFLSRLRVDKRWLLIGSSLVTIVVLGAVGVFAIAPGLRGKTTGLALAHSRTGGGGNPCLTTGTATSSYEGYATLPYQPTVSSAPQPPEATLPYQSPFATAPTMPYPTPYPSGATLPYEPPFTTSPTLSYPPPYATLPYQAPTTATYEPYPSYPTLPYQAPTTANYPPYVPAPTLPYQGQYATGPTPCPP